MSIENTEAAAQASGMPLSHARAFQQVAKIRIINSATHNIL